MTPAKPSLDLLRSLTDEHVLRALMAEPRLTRAEIAARTGISKPTVGESVRRLTEGGLLRDTGERTTGRGRIGSYYALAEDVGVALVVSIAPDGIVAEAVDVQGQVLTRELEQVGRPARPARVSRALADASGRAAAAATGPVRLAVVSAADPVDRASGRLVHLPDAPFLVGELSPVDVLAPLVAGPVTVDNDVNWAARAERAAADPGELDDFAYLYLGEGLGCAVVADGEVRRGHGGLAGEVAHIWTIGPSGAAVRFTDVFAELGVRRAGSTAVDVARLTTAFDRSSSTRRQVAAAVAGVLSAGIAMADPSAAVLGGDWGRCAGFVDALRRELEDSPRPVPIVTSAVDQDPELSGARNACL